MSMRTRSFVLLGMFTLLACVSGSGCKSGAGASAPAPLDLLAHRQSLLTTTLSGYVLLPADATLYTSEDAARATSSAPTRPARISPNLAPGSLQAVELFAVIEDKGEVIEVETLSRAQRRAHCVRRSSPLMGAASVRFFVQKSALLPVLKKVYTETFEDGSGFSFAPGLPLALEDRGAATSSKNMRVIGAAHGLARPISVNAQQVGLSYDDASPFLEAANKAAFKKLPKDTTLWLDDRPLLRVEELADELSFARDDRNAGMNRTMVALSSTCVRIVARTLDLQIERSRIVEPKEALAATSEEPRTRAQEVRLLGLREGAALTWPDGKTAGEVREEIWLNVEFEERGERYCFAFGQTPGALVCVPRSSTVISDQATPAKVSP
jgi:hypothetical protein